MDGLGHRVAGGRGHNPQHASADDHTAQQLAQHRRLPDPLGQLATELPDQQNRDKDEEETGSRVAAGLLLRTLLSGLAALAALLHGRGKRRGRVRPGCGGRRPVTAQPDQEEAGDDPEHDAATLDSAFRGAGQRHRRPPSLIVIRTIGSVTTVIVHRR